MEGNVVKVSAQLPLVVHFSPSNGRWRSGSLAVCFITKALTAAAEKSLNFSMTVDRNEYLKF